MKDIFRYFIQKNLPALGAELSIDEIDEIGNEFHEYLDELLTSMNY